MQFPVIFSSKSLSPSHHKSSAQQIKPNSSRQRSARKRTNYHKYKRMCHALALTKRLEPTSDDGGKCSFPRAFPPLKREKRNLGQSNIALLKWERHRRFSFFLVSFSKIVGLFFGPRHGRDGHFRTVLVTHSKNERFSSNNIRFLFK